jgi:2,4-dienoyl-CoA reductase-like NADH-dependent reductase (Old Yellow Enzyme family)
MGDSNLAATFGYVAEPLGLRKLAFLCLREAVGPDSLGPQMKKLFKGGLIANENFDGPAAEAILRAGHADAVAFGKSYIANADLVERLRQGRELNVPDPSTFYGGGSRGYVDYPVLQEA